MFTGIIQRLGTARRLARKGANARLTIEGGALLRGVRIGESLAVDGVCLTVTARQGGTFSADVGPETLKRTTLGDLRAGDRVNLERSLRMGDLVGGHLVSGHVEAVGKILHRRQDGEAYHFFFGAPRPFLRYVVPRGSVAVDGVSLTVTAVDGRGFGVMIIPHTAAVTTLGFKQVGDRVNLEADLLAKYVERLVMPRTMDRKRSGQAFPSFVRRGEGR